MGFRYVWPLLYPLRTPGKIAFGLLVLAIALKAAGIYTALAASLMGQ